MRTTLTLEDEVVLKLRQFQKKHPDRSFKRIVNDAINKGLSTNGDAPRKPFRIRTFKNARPKPGLNFDNVWKLLSEVEGPAYK